MCRTNTAYHTRGHNAIERPHLQLQSEVCITVQRLVVECCGEDIDISLLFVGFLPLFLRLFRALLAFASPSLWGWTLFLGWLHYYRIHCLFRVTVIYAYTAKAYSRLVSKI